MLVLGESEEGLAAGRWGILEPTIGVNQHAIPRRMMPRVAAGVRRSPRMPRRWEKERSRAQPRASESAGSAAGSARRAALPMPAAARA